MANEFKIKNGLVVDQGGAQITGSVQLSGSISTPGNIFLTSSSHIRFTSTGSGTSADYGDLSIYRYPTYDTPALKVTRPDGIGFNIYRQGSNNNIWFADEDGDRNMILFSNSFGAFSFLSPGSGQDMVFRGGNSTGIYDTSMVFQTFDRTTTTGSANDHAFKFQGPGGITSPGTHLVSFQANSSEVAAVLHNGSITSSGTGSFTDGRFTGNVGIGTTTPRAKLNIEDSTHGTLMLSKPSETGYALISGSSGLGFEFKTYDAGEVMAMKITNTGNVGIGTTTPLTTLHVNGNLKSNFLSLGSTSTNANPGIFPVNTSYSSLTPTGRNLTFYTYNQNITAGTSIASFNFAGETISLTSNVYNSVGMYRRFGPSSGDATYTDLYINPLIIQNNATGDVKGIVYNPTLTSLSGSHTAIQTTSGDIKFQGEVNVEITGSLNLVQNSTRTIEINPSDRKIVIGGPTDYSAQLHLNNGRIQFGRDGSAGGGYFFNNDSDMQAQMANSFYIYDSSILGDKPSPAFGELSQISGGGGSVRGGFLQITRFKDTSNDTTFGREKVAHYINAIEGGTGPFYLSKYHNSGNEAFSVRTSGDTYISGSVGIGTRAPLAKLHVFTTGSVAEVLIQGKGDTLNQGSKLILSGSGASTTRRAIIELHGNHTSATDPSSIKYYFDDTLKYQVGYRPTSGRGYYISAGNGVNDSILYLNELDNNNVTITRDLTVTGKVTAQEFHTEFVSSSIIYESGSTKFGDSSDDVHQFTGSVEVSSSISMTTDGHSYTYPLEINSDSIILPSNNGTQKTTLGQNNVGGFLSLKNSSATETAIIRSYNSAGVQAFFNAGNVGIGTSAPSQKLEVNGNILATSAVTSSQLIVSSSGTAVATIQGSGSSAPIFEVVGSQGQLFSVVDSFTGSLFSINDISGLPLFDVDSSETITIGDFTAPAITAVGSNTILSGSIRSEVNALSIASSTASLDLSQGNFFSLTLAAGASTYLSASNIQPGQTVNIEITQPGTVGTLSYGSEFKFPGGIPYEVSAVTSAIDILTLVTFDTSTIYATALKNMS